jgi:hypothetical protein
MYGLGDIFWGDRANQTGMFQTEANADRPISLLIMMTSVRIHLAYRHKQMFFALPLH